MQQSKYPNMPLDVIGRLGGGTRQAVSKAGDARHWLGYRMRCALLRMPPGAPCEAAAWQPAVIQQRAEKAATGLLEQHKPYLDGLECHLLQAGAQGRPSRLTLIGFETFLGVEKGSGYLQAYTAYIKWLLGGLALALRAQETKHKGLGEALDEWLPARPYVPACPRASQPGPRPA